MNLEIYPYFSPFIYPSSYMFPILILYSDYTQGISNAQNDDFLIILGEKVLKYRRITPEIFHENGL